MGDLGAPAAVWTDSATFAVSIAALLLMHSRPIARATEHASVFTEARQGFAYVASRPWLWGPIVASPLVRPPVQELGQRAGHDRSPAPGAARDAAESIPGLGARRCLPRGAGDRAPRPRAG